MLRYTLFSDSSKVVSIESEEQFNDSVRKAEDESQPAIFYFTAAWCAPCRLLSPMIGQLSEKYPHVTTYKVDIDKGCFLFSQFITYSTKDTSGREISDVESASSRHR